MYLCMACDVAICIPCMAIITGAAGWDRSTGREYQREAKERW